MIPNWMEWAEFYIRKFGMPVIPMGENKKPMICWKPYQDRLPTRKEVERWPKGDMAIITGVLARIVVVDCESREDADWFWRNRGTTNAVVSVTRMVATL